MKRTVADGTPNRGDRIELLQRRLGVPVRGTAFYSDQLQMLVKWDDGRSAALERSRDLAAEVGDKLTLSYALRHLGIAEHSAGRLDEALERLEESLRLRREIGFLPGVAANLVGLAYIAAAKGRRDEALALIEEAGAISEASDAKGIMRQVAEARTQL